MGKLNYILSVVIAIIALICNIGPDLYGAYHSLFVSPYTFNYDDKTFVYYYSVGQQLSFTLFFISWWLSTTNKQLKIFITYFIIVSIPALLNDITKDALVWHIGDVIVFFTAILYTFSLLKHNKTNEQSELRITDK